MLKDFNEANSETFLHQLEPSIPPINYVTRSQTFWIPIHAGLVKLNFDAAIDVLAKVGVTSVVIHNFDEHFLTGAIICGTLSRTPYFLKTSLVGRPLC